MRWKTKCLIYDYILFVVNLSLFIVAGMDFSIAISAYLRGQYTLAIADSILGIILFLQGFSNAKKIIKELKEDKNG